MVERIASNMNSDDENQFIVVEGSSDMEMRRLEVLAYNRSSSEPLDLSVRRSANNQ